MRGANLWLEEAAPDYRRALATLDITSVTPEVDKALAQAGLWYPPGDPSREILGLALLRAQVRLLDLMERRLAGQIMEPPSEAPQVPQASSGALDAASICRLHREGEKPAHIAKRLGVARSTVYEALKTADTAS